MLNKPVFMRRKLDKNWAGYRRNIITMKMGLPGPDIFSFLYCFQGTEMTIKMKQNMLNAFVKAFSASNDE